LRCISASEGEREEGREVEGVLPGEGGTTRTPGRRLPRGEGRKGEETNYLYRLLDLKVGMPDLGSSPPSQSSEKKRGGRSASDRKIRLPLKGVGAFKKVQERPFRRNEEEEKSVGHKDYDFGKKKASRRYDERKRGKRRRKKHR